MDKYMKPMALKNEELIEGVYAASGDSVAAKECDSIYMNGVWQGSD